MRLLNQAILSFCQCNPQAEIDFPLIMIQFVTLLLEARIFNRLSLRIHL